MRETDFKENLELVEEIREEDWQMDIEKFESIACSVNYN